MAGIIVGVVVIVIVVAGYIWVSGGSAAPSATLSAPTLAIATQAPTATSAPTLAATPEVTSQVTSQATAEAAATTEATAGAAAPSGAVVLNIVTDQSKVSFTLGEDLLGKPNTVVGTTNEVAGQIAVDFAHPANSQVGEIRIDARSLATDNQMRDRMICGQILQSAQGSVPIRQL